MDFDSYAAHFALTPERQAEVDRRMRDDLERISAKEAEVTAKSVADELERVEIESMEKELKAVSAAKLKEHRRPQHGERIEYQGLGIGPASGQPWPTDGEIREILRKDPPPSGTVYATHFAIRFPHNQMVPTPVQLADAPGDAAQAQLREQNPFASRNTVTLTSTLPTQGQAECIAEGNSPRVAGSLLRDQRRANKWWL